MRVKEMEEEDDGSRSISSSMSLEWSSETNWVVSHGSLHDSVSVESPFYDPIHDSDPRSPLVLEAPAPDSSPPCDIKICFRQKCEISQIYVRSTARVYEIYYAQSPQSGIEYLSTVRCGVAERDGQLLQTACIEDVDKENGECLTGELAEGIVADGRSNSPGEDDWVKIKAPVDGRSYSLDKNKIGTSENIHYQDLYEATAQISDADPCSLLMIRLLSLQDKSQVYIDEVYVFVDPVESSDSGNEQPPVGSVAQSPLMAMLVPTLLQLSKSGVSRAQGKHASDELLKDEKSEVGVRRITEADAELGKHKIDQNEKPKDHELDEVKSAQIRQPTTSLNMEPCADTVGGYTPRSPPGQFERALEQLTSRVSRVEDICLRFEEKLLKPIERMEARLESFEHQLETRLQQVEHQLEKLMMNSQDSGFPKGTRISAPPFSVSESNSSSFHNDGSDYPPCGVLEREKESFSCNKIPVSSDGANIRPGLVVSAPEFSCGEDEEDNDYLKGSPQVKPKQSLSVDDALAAALSGFLATAKQHPSEQMQETCSLSNEVVDKKEQHSECPESRQKEMHGFPAAEEEPKQFTQILAVIAPEFAAEEIGDEEHRDDRQSSSAADCVRKNDEDKDGSASGFDDNRSSTELRSSSDGVSYLNMQHSFPKDDYSWNDAKTSDGSPRGLVEKGKALIYDEINPRETNNATHDDEGSAVKEGGHASEGLHDVLKRYNTVEIHSTEDSPDVPESLYSSTLDFEFPILDVKFDSDMHTCTMSSLETLSDGEAELNFQSSVHENNGNEDGNIEQISLVVADGNGTSDLLPSNRLLVDVGISSADGFSNLEDGFLQLDGGSHDHFSLNSPEVIVSLI